VATEVVTSGETSMEYSLEPSAKLWGLLRRAMRPFEMEGGADVAMVEGSITCSGKNKIKNALIAFPLQ
jgi:hypothetical protein